jgi:DNA-binding transcriptional MerR regulator
LKLGSMFRLGTVDGFRVSELAGRAGVAPSTVRFYERAGLLSPPRRAANGYRVFGESALDELAFISRAKGIGMSLEDIAGLRAAWPAGECRSLRARLRAFLAGRLGQVHEQVAGLRAFEGRLKAVIGRLSAPDSGPGRCGQGCICETALDPAPDEATEGSGPWGCSLDPGELATRIGQWRALAATATSAERTGGAVVVVLPAGPETAASAAALCAAETACCGQTRFLLDITAGQLTLTAEAPGTPGLLDALLPDGLPGLP